MAVVPTTLACMIYPKNKTDEPYPATIVGYAWITGLSVGGGPAEPPGELPPGGPSDAHPEHPIVLPPTDPAPPDELPPNLGVVKPPPPEGGWGYSPAYGWGYFPGKGGAGPKR